MNAKSLTEILAIQTGYSHWVTLASLKDVPDDAYYRPPAGGGNDENETMGSLLAGMAFHEAYHAGQIGVIRRTLGFGGIVK